MGVIKPDIEPQFDFDKLLDGVVGVVEATSYERHMLWQEYSTTALKLREGGPDKRTRYTWRQGLIGHGHNVGMVDRRPIVISLNVDTVAGHRILFWHPTSQVVDYVMIENRLDELLPGRKRVDPMNFFNLVHILPEKVSIFCG